MTRLVPRRQTEDQRVALPASAAHRRSAQIDTSATHLVCERERAEWVICSKRTRAILIQLNGRLSNVLVNVGRFCS